VATSGLIPEFIAMLQSENVMELNSAVGVFRNLALPGTWKGKASCCDVHV